jgi:hypothetical protein
MLFHVSLSSCWSFCTFLLLFLVAVVVFRVFFILWYWVETKKEKSEDKGAARLLWAGLERRCAGTLGNGCWNAELDRTDSVEFLFVVVFLSEKKSPSDRCPLKFSEKAI